jgi:hypothetical protein
MDRLLVVALVLAVVAGLAYARARLRAGGHPERVEPGDVGLSGRDGVAAAAFVSPRCLACQAWERELSDRGVPLSTVDVAEQPAIARRYRLHTTPLVLAVRRADGRVLAAYDGDPDPEHVDRIAALASG